jgi:hypothetical protein
MSSVPEATWLDESDDGGNRHCPPALGACSSRVGTHKEDPRRDCVTCDDADDGDSWVDNRRAFRILPSPSTYYGILEEVLRQDDHGEGPSANVYLELLALYVLQKRRMTGSEEVEEDCLLCRADGQRYQSRLYDVEYPGWNHPEGLQRLLEERRCCFLQSTYHSLIRKERSEFCARYLDPLDKCKGMNSINRTLTHSVSSSSYFKRCSPVFPSY